MPDKEVAKELQSVSLTRLWWQGDTHFCAQGPGPIWALAFTPQAGSFYAAGQDSSR